MFIEIKKQILIDKNTSDFRIPKDVNHGHLNLEK